MRWSSLLGLLALLVVGCDESRPSSPPTAPPRPEKPATTAKPAATTLASVPWRFPEAERVVALGDVHGDLNATRRALRLGGLIDDDEHWSGGTAVLVQTGDVLDRGDDEQAILDLLARLQEEAKAAGGAVHLLNGNHELMNAAGDFRYVTPGGFRDFEDVSGLDVTDPRVTRFPLEQRHRVAAFLPGGRYARRIASQPVVVVVGDTVFTHGGVLPKYAPQIDRLNAEVTAWLLGGPPQGARVVMTPDSPVWSRHYSDETGPEQCALLEDALRALGAKRMVVGHTVQKTANAACDGKVWRIDVGMAAHYGGRPEVLLLEAGEARVEREKAL
ncbi:MAG: shewanella-like protein phosphatase [Polyangiaceae bacterium]